jgi:hypothetical protein
MKILFGVFDWGLGHATRDLPLIEELVKENEVDIVSTGRALEFLKQHFKERCHYLDIPSIYVPYSKTRYFTLYFIKGIPRMTLDLGKARLIMRKVLSAGSYDKVISDCRFDVYDKQSNSYLINHQVRFKAFRVAEDVAEKWLHWQTEHYKSVIVPDFEENNLSGELSHNLRYVRPHKIEYIGILSQLKKKKVRKDIDYFFPISGPEPQRTVLAQKIFKILPHLDGRIVVALGKAETQYAKTLKSVEVYSILYQKQQEDVMNRSKFIICRSGYTTVMELCELDIKQALLIPTPGQTEQEYLSMLYEKRGIFHSVSQDKLHLPRDIEVARRYKGFECPWKTKQSVRNFMQVIG